MGHFWDRPTDSHPMRIQYRHGNSRILRIPCISEFRNFSRTIPQIRVSVEIQNTTGGGHFAPDFTPLMVSSRQIPIQWEFKISMQIREFAEFPSFNIDYDDSVVDMANLIIIIRSPSREVVIYRHREDSEFRESR